MASSKAAPQKSTSRVLGNRHQRWCNLSNMAVEEALCDRLSFVRFVGLSLDHDEVPDATTLCRFHQSLVERNILKRLLDKRNHQLKRQGLLVLRGHCRCQRRFLRTSSPLGSRRTV